MADQWRNDLGVLGLLMAVMLIIFLVTLWASSH
jgi:hypothetical protein